MRKRVGRSGVCGDRAECSASGHWTGTRGLTLIAQAQGENEAAQKMRPPSSSKLKYHECHAFFFAALAFAYRSAVDCAGVAALAGRIRVGICSLADSHRAADIARIFDTG